MDQIYSDSTVYVLKIKLPNQNQAKLEIKSDDVVSEKIIEFIKENKISKSLQESIEIYVNRKLGEHKIEFKSNKP